MPRRRAKNPVYRFPSGERVVDETALAPAPRRPPAPPAERSERVLPFVSYEAARRLYEQASELDTDPKTYALAEELYRRALALDPTFAKALSNLARVRWLQGDHDEAVGMFARAADIDTHDADIQYNAGSVLAETYAPPKVVRPYLERAIQLNPTLQDAYYKLGAILVLENNWLGARALWRRYLERFPHGQHAAWAKNRVFEMELRIHDADRPHAKPQAPKRRRRRDDAGPAPGAAYRERRRIEADARAAAKKRRYWSVSAIDDDGVEHDKGFVELAPKAPPSDVERALKELGIFAPRGEDRVRWARTGAFLYDASGGLIAILRLLSKGWRPEPKRKQNPTTRTKEPWQMSYPEFLEVYRSGRTYWEDLSDEEQNRIKNARAAEMRAFYARRFPFEAELWDGRPVTVIGPEDMRTTHPAGIAPGQIRVVERDGEEVIVGIDGLHENGRSVMTRRPPRDPRKERGVFAGAGLIMGELNAYRAMIEKALRAGHPVPKKTLTWLGLPAPPRRPARSKLH